MRPYFGSGFGTFSRILGPWTDFFPSSGGAGLDTSQFGVAVGTKIQAGSDGATITRIIVESPFNIAGSNNALNWRLLVLKGDLDERTLWNALDNEFQLATQGWPRKGGSELRLPVLFEKIIGNQRTPNSYSSGVTDEPVVELGDDSPATISGGEVMTAFITPMFNASGVPGYGANNSSFVNFTVVGKYFRNTAFPMAKVDQVGRSIPRGRISGV